MIIFHELSMCGLNEMCQMFVSKSKKTYLFFKAELACLFKRMKTLIGDEKIFFIKI
jgi:hypothetical protein